MVTMRTLVTSLIVLGAAGLMYAGGYYSGSRSQNQTAREARIERLVNDSLKTRADSLNKTVQLLHSQLDANKAVAQHDSAKLDSLSRHIQVEPGKVVIDKKPFVVPIQLTDYIQEQAQTINNLRIEVATAERRTVVQDSLLAVQQERIDSLAVAYDIAKGRESKLPFIGGLILGGVAAAALHFLLK